MSSKPVAARPDWRALLLGAELALMRLGALPLLAGVLLLAGLLVTGVQLLRPDADETVLRETLARRREELHALQLAANAPPDAAAARMPLAELLGEGERVEHYVQQLFRAARALELGLDSGEYRWLRDAQAETDRYQIRLPVKGSYAAIRAFGEKVLAELPFASLDEFTLKREAIDADQLVATLQFSLHLHPGAAGRAALKEERR
jgi:hypothetical protein